MTKKQINELEKKAKKIKSQKSMTYNDLEDILTLTLNKIYKEDLQKMKKSKGGQNGKL